MFFTEKKKSAEIHAMETLDENPIQIFSFHSNCLRIEVAILNVKRAKLQ